MTERVTAVNETALHGEWIHSHEEDTEHEMIFRREGFPFPRARGRSSITFSADGTYTALNPGPADAPVASAGTWSLAGDRLTLTAGRNRGDAACTYAVRRENHDRLIARRV